jgi:hypothetical protein
MNSYVFYLNKYKYNNFEDESRMWMSERTEKSEILFSNIFVIFS